MTENLELYLKIITTVAGIFVAYHKFIMSEINKKMTEMIAEKQQEILAEKRLNIEIMFEERTRLYLKNKKKFKKI